MPRAVLPAGVLTSDPRIVPSTVPVTELTFEEATELAYFGAQVLHPQAMQPAIRSGKMNVRVKNSYNRCAGGGGLGRGCRQRRRGGGRGARTSYNQASKTAILNVFPIVTTPRVSTWAWACLPAWHLQHQLGPPPFAHIADAPFARPAPVPSVFSLATPTRPRAPALPRCAPTPGRPPAPSSRRTATWRAAW